MDRSYIYAFPKTSALPHQTTPQSHRLLQDFLLALLTWETKAELELVGAADTLPYCARKQPCDMRCNGHAYTQCVRGGGAHTADLTRQNKKRAKANQVNPLLR